MTDVEIGHAEGASNGYFTYTLRVLTEEEGLLWEGEIDGKVNVNENGQVSLSVRQPLPPELHKVLSENTMVMTEWKPAWEEVDEKRLPPAV